MNLKIKVDETLLPLFLKKCQIYVFFQSHKIACLVPILLCDQWRFDLNV